MSVNAGPETRSSRLTLLGSHWDQTSLPSTCRYCLLSVRLQRSFRHRMVFIADGEFVCLIAIPLHARTTFLQRFRTYTRFARACCAGGAASRVERMGGIR
jgi:hypothetical protein